MSGAVWGALLLVAGRLFFFFLSRGSSHKMHLLVGFAALSAVAPVVVAQITQAITDLSLLHQLAPCASRAIYWNHFSASKYADCSEAAREGAPEFQSCLCSDSDASSQFASNISTAVASDCATDAEDDQSSAARVLEKYCSPGETTITFDAPSRTVTDMITDIDKLNFLAPCASSAMSWVVMYSASSRCPEPASRFAPCVCSKSDVVDYVHSALSSRILGSCDSKDDVEMALDFYSEYCAMNNGTTSFAPAPTPPGDMTYYITAMDEYSSLSECARHAISNAVLKQTSEYCPDGPQALASCVCLKSGRLQDVYGTMTRRVALDCDSDDKDSEFKAVDVLNLYCSAAESKVVLKVADTVTQASPTAAGGSRNDGPTRETGTSEDNNNNNNNNNSEDGGGDGGLAPGAIAGVVIGAVAGVALIAAGIFWLMRHRRKREASGGPIAVAQADSPYVHGELDGVSRDKSPAELGSIHPTPSPGFAVSEVPGAVDMRSQPRSELPG